MENKHNTFNKSTHSVQIKELLKIADKVIDLEEDTYLFQEGMESNEIFVILSGKVLISKLNSDGQELTLRICGENDICGELTLFTTDSRYLLNAKIIQSGKIAIVKKSVLEKEILSNNELGFEFLKWMNDHFRKTMTKFRDLVLNGKKGALYSTLIRMSNSFGVNTDKGILIDYSITNQELAGFCGSSRESVNRFLNDLKRDGIISFKKGKITIHDLEYLKNEIGCENCPVVYCSIE